MAKLQEARKFLTDVGMPVRQRADICCYALLALAGVGEQSPWHNADNQWWRIHDIIGFIFDKYQVKYAENSRETFRKQAMHHFRLAAVIEDNGKATNSPQYRYRLTYEALEVIQAMGSTGYDGKVRSFLLDHAKLVDLYESKKKMLMMPIRINGERLMFSTGDHNALQKAIVEEFGARFAPGAECLYIGDTINKALVKNDAKLAELGFAISSHDKMPDVVLYDAQKDWLYFVEAVTSTGPMSAKRVLEIQGMTRQVKSGKIFVTAFLHLKAYKRFVEELAWDTEVWIADMPDHMIHLNGDRFCGPR